VTVQPRRIAVNVLRVCKKLLDGGDTALIRARDHESPLRSRRYDSHAGGRRVQENRPDDPGHNDQTGAAACARVQRGGTLLDTYVRSLSRLESSAMAVDSAYDKIIGVAKTKKAQREARERAAAESLPPGAGHCVACGKWMPGGPVHRIVRGLCPKHKTGYRRARDERGLTRAEYIDEVRRQRCPRSTIEGHDEAP
jgi:hypothetical protein